MSLLNHSLGTLARDIPGATRVFHHYRLDYCCGGNVLLSEALAERGARIIAAGCERIAAIPLPDPATTGPTSDSTTDPAIDAIAAIQSFYRLVEALARRRGLDPDAPPHLAKVTRTR